jgi:hypothetical protein
MKRKSKNTKEHESHQVIEELADFLLEESSVYNEGIQDPFEEYSNRVKSHLFADSHRFKDRFAQGFHAIMKEIESRSP